MTKTKPAALTASAAVAENTQSQQQPQQRGLRKNNVWTRDKISRLIRLYRQHECLWNNYIEAYKNKDKRTQAIEDICTNLRISKFDFGKKIHNLRNQFNAEMKKLERRLEESGVGDGTTTIDAAHFRSRWEHYESLQFLKDVIAPRPGYQSGVSYQHTRKIELKYQHQNSDDEDGTHVIIARVDDLEPEQETTAATQANETIEEDETQYHFEEATAEEEAEMAEEVAAVDDYMSANQLATRSNDELLDQKYNPPTTLREVVITTVPGSSQVSTPISSACKATTYFTAVHHGHRKTTHAPQFLNNTKTTSTSATQPSSTTHLLQPQHDTASCVSETAAHSQHLTTIEYTPAAAQQNNSPSTSLPPQQQIQRLTKRRTSDSTQSNAAAQPQLRDQWDAFGEMVAAEFRNLNSDLSRKKLKRKIMQAMLEVGEADDGININIAIN